MNNISRPPPIAWHTSFKLVGWWPTAISTLALAGGFVAVYPAARVAGGAAALARIIEVVVVLAFGAQAAFLLAPDGEPPLELLLASPRPPAWLLWERLLVLAGLQGSVALAASLVSLALAQDGGLALMTVRWLAPATFLGGVAVLATHVTRQGVFGALLATLLWAGMLFGGDALLSRWPWLWPVHLFLQPDMASPLTYAANRAGLILMGVGLLALTPLLLRDEERALGLARRSGG